MGEEYAESAPFHYFVSHSGKRLIRTLREEKRRNYERFKKTGLPFADPQDEQTFEISRLDHSLKDKGKHEEILEYYCELIRLRKNFSCFRISIAIPSRSK